VTDSLYSGAERAYKRLREAYQGRKLSKRKGIEATETAEEREIRLQSLKETLETLLVGDGEALLDGQFMDTISKWTEPLLDSKQYEKLETLIERLVKALEHPNQRVRNQAATALAWIIDHLPQDRQAETLEKLVNPLVVWIKRETAATAAYRFFCFRLRDQIVKYLKEKKYEACLPLIDVFHLIDYGRLEKNDTIQEIAAEVINSLATTERLDVLFELYSKSEEKEKKDLGRLLARMGEGSLRRLMDLLRDHPNSDERVKILHLIVDIGPSAISVIKETSREDAPWYYHRNLAYLLGFIKSPKTLEVLQTLLNHQHHKVRHEALKSLYRIGDEDRGPVLLSILPNVDDSFKIAIVEMLGKLKYQNAVPVLAEMLKNRPFLVTAGRMELEEHICTALGKIGSPAAVPILTEISKPKFFSVSSYPEKVKIAATKALREINLK
ncbi:MAG: HEAT repeat domain-containing protein, partial [Syntrophales bacterium]|nr:HEAT repeat domain-containing protein [Syntrophales bacterium]